MIKRLLIIIITIVLITSLTGCMVRTYTYELMHDVSKIDKIELLKNDDATKLKDFSFTVLHTLNDDEVERFVEKLSAIDCYKYFNDPAGNFGELTIRIYYDNGDIEMIGIMNNGYIENGKALDRGPCFFLDEDFYGLFEEYVNPDLL